MGEIQVKVDAEAINRTVADAIIRSSIGEKMKEVIDVEVAKWSKTYDNPMAAIVKSEISQEVTRLVREEYGEKLREYVAARVTEDFTKDLLDRIWEAARSTYYR